MGGIKPVPDVTGLPIIGVRAHARVTYEPENPTHPA
jgi:hypothetical protein